jgi:hypothetical protein
LGSLSFFLFFLVSLGQVYQKLGGELHPSSIDFSFSFCRFLGGCLLSFCFCFFPPTFFILGGVSLVQALWEKWIPKQHFHFEKEKDAALTPTNPPLSYAVPISLQQNRKEFKGLAADWQGL